MHAFKKLKLYLYFFKGKFFIPLIFSVFIVYTFQLLFLGFMGLACTSVFVWFYHHYLNDIKKQHLYFYFNFGLSELQLYIFTFILNLILLLISYYLLQ